MFYRYSKSLCSGYWWAIKIGDWNCKSMTCDTKGFSDTGACTWEANSAMGFKQFWTDWHTAGGNRWEVLPLPNSRGSRLNTTQNAIGFSRLLDATPGEYVPTLNLKKVFSTCLEKFCSINGAKVGRLLDESMRQERAMLAQAETESKAPFGGQPQWSTG